MHLPVLGILLQRQLQLFKRRLVVALQEMDQADLVVAGRIPRFKRQAALECRQRFVVASKLEQYVPQVEVREEIVFERGDDPKLFGGFGQQAVALVVEAKRVVSLTQLRVARDRAALLLDGLPDPMGALQVQAALEMNQRLFPLRLIEHCRHSEALVSRQSTLDSPAGARCNSNAHGRPPVVDCRLPTDCLCRSGATRSAHPAARSL